MNLWTPAAEQSYMNPTYFQNHHDNLNNAFNFLNENGLTGTFANIVNYTLSNPSYANEMTEQVTNWMYNGIVPNSGYNNVTLAYCTVNFVPSASSVMSNIGNNTETLQSGLLYRITQLIAEFNDPGGDALGVFSPMNRPTNPPCTTAGGQSVRRATATALIAQALDWL